MKAFFLRFLVSRAGGILTPIVATIVGALVAKLAAFDSALASGLDQAAITGFVVAAILSVVNYVTNSVQTEGIKKIQAMVNVRQDGIPGPVTYTEVRKAIPVEG
jgi:uncharacterized membrane protein YeaQ/YmgE (transglycosylase-associated protein family)